MSQRVKQKLLLALSLSLILAAGSPVMVSDACTNQQSCSSNYGVNEVFFGNGGTLDNECSTSYCAKTSIGETGIGQSCSASYCAQAGFNTDRQPFLQFIVNAATTPDLTGANGPLIPGTPQTDTATFSVEDYLSSGYVVTTNSNSPANSAYHMSTPSSPENIGTMATNNHEFGINLATNTGCGGGLPPNFGTSPTQAPDSTFGFGAAATGYNTACNFKYVNGGTIASSPKSSGETDYTISYVFLANNLTPGGTYIINQVLVATATY